MAKNILSCRGYEVRVSSPEAFIKQVEDAGYEVKRDGSGLFSKYLGSIPVVADTRIPDGVWVLVPSGETITGPGVKVGGFDRESKSLASAFDISRCEADTERKEDK